MTHRERLLKVARGEWADCIPWMPRIDLWHNANELAGTLPEPHKGRSVEEIYRAEGWPLHKVIPEYLKPEAPEDIHHRAIGLYRLKELPYDFELPPDLDVRVEELEAGDEHMTRVEYHTPVGMVSVQHGYTEQMKRSGASITWVKEHAIKKPADYKVLAWLFANLKLKPAYGRFLQWKQSVGEDGIAVAQGLGIGCASPMHFIQKTLLGATEFYLHYNDFRREMEELAEALEGPYNQLIAILADAPVDAVLWAGNVDDMVTYPAYYKKDLLPWCLKASDALHPKGILLLVHPDGENRGIMDLVAESGMDVADAVTPYPMTKLTINEYYDRWCRTDRLTIQGGIPEMLLLPESATWDDLKSYLDNFFKAVHPGKRIIASIGDTSPPNTEFQRLIYIGERFEKEGRLPMKAGGANPLSAEMLQRAGQRSGSGRATDGAAGLEQALLQVVLANSGALSRLFRGLADVLDRFGGADPEEALSGTGAGRLDRPVAARDAGTAEVAPAQKDPFAVIRDGVLSGNRDELKRQVQVLLDGSYKASDILEKGMLAAMEVIGERFKDGSVFIPEVLLSARAMNEAMALLEPHLAGKRIEASGKVMVGTVRGDLHDIGKNMVVTMLRGVGFETQDLGVNVSVEDFVKKVREGKPDILGMSALLTTTMPEMKKIIQALENEGLKEGLKIMVGGAPVNAKFARDIGADGYAADAGEAVTLARQLIAE